MFGGHIPWTNLPAHSRQTLEIKISPSSMDRRRNKTRSNMLRKAFQGRRPNTTRMYASRLETLAKRLGMDDIPREKHDILSPWWLADPDHILRVLQQGGYSTNTIKSYLTAVTALLSYVSSTGRLEGDRAAARLLVGIYRSKHADVSPSDDSCNKSAHNSRR